MRTKLLHLALCLLLLIPLSSCSRTSGSGIGGEEPNTGISSFEDDLRIELEFSSSDPVTVDFFVLQTKSVFGSGSLFRDGKEVAITEYTSGSELLQKELKTSFSSKTSILSCDYDISADLDKLEKEEVSVTVKIRIYRNSKQLKEHSFTHKLTTLSSHKSDHITALSTSMEKAK